MVFAAVVGLLQIAQPQPDGLAVGPPVFKAGVHVVPIYVALMNDRGPWTGLTLDDFMVVLDKKPYAPAEVAVDPEKPNHYAVYFKPPDDARDGKKHSLQLKVKRAKSGSWATLPFKTSITLPKPSSSVAAALSMINVR